MRPIFLLSLLAFLSPSPGHSQQTQMWLDLPHGKVSIEINGVEGNLYGRGLVAQAGGDQEILIDSEYLPEVVTKHDNSALLRVFTGGNACPTMYAWLTFDKAGLRATSTFGTCAEVGNIVGTRAYPSLILGKLDVHLQKVRFDFDGKTVIEKTL